MKTSFQLEELGIGGNPINCSCETAFLLEDEYFSYEYTNTLPKCALPPELKGRLLTRVAQSDACAAKLTAEMGSRFTGSVIFDQIGTCGIVVGGAQRYTRRINPAPAAYQAFHPFGVCKFVPDLSGE
uniref:LRRCT domain-containing protein n=1 Tax=Angiostrongylus cantonensis TaxID=6313 RepID=A0A0K0D8U5_ANGCA